MMIRQFQPGDAQACFDLILDCIRQDGGIPQSTRKALLRGESAQSICERARLFHMAVYEIDREIAGIGGLDMNEIRLLYVSPEHQRCGFGQALLRYLEAMVPPSFFSDIFVYSTLAAERFYQSHGYQTRGKHVLELHGESLATIFMVKVLQPAVDKLNPRSVPRA